MQWPKADLLPAPYRQKAFERLQGAPFTREAFRYVGLPERLLPIGSARSCLEGASPLSLEEAFQSYGFLLLNRWLGKGEQDPLFLHNSAFSPGQFLYLPPGWTGNELTLTHPLTPFVTHLDRLHLFLGRGTKASLHEITSGAGMANTVIDLVLEEGAELTLIQEIQDSPFFFSSIRARLKGSSRLHFLQLSRGQHRSSIEVELAAPGAEAVLQGLWLTQKQAHAHVTVSHLAPSCRSRQHFKCILDGEAKTSFEGKIFVAPEAAQTEAYQICNQLLLSDKATAYAKPNLEIFADEVKASHGATFSQLSKEEMFYLSSRGLNPEQARHLLLDAFCRELVPLRLQSRWLHA
jgi:Fe-S cluster assembly protein SufD